jgi:hypothetical protein
MLKKYDALASSIVRDGNVACVAWRHNNRSSCRNAIAERTLVVSDRDENIGRSDPAAAIVAIIRRFRSWIGLMTIFRPGDLVIVKSGPPIMTFDMVNADTSDDDKVGGV